CTVAFCFFFSSRRRHTRFSRDWSSDCALPIFEDDDGCPDKKPLVEVTKEEIRINQKIMFGHDSADIQKESDELLDAVAETLKQRSEERRVGKECRCRW